MGSLPSNIDLESEIKNFDYCWHQGPTSFKEAQKSAKKIAELLALSYGCSFSSKHIVKKIMHSLGYLNGISAYKIKNLLELF